MQLRVTAGTAGRLAPVLVAALCGALAPAPAPAAETFAVVALGDPPAGPDADLAELAHQLRAACRDRVGSVLDVPSMQARLRGQSDGATLSELDRAYGGALAVYQNGEFESALRTLQAIVQDIEALPEGREPYQQWIRASLRLAHAAATIGRNDVADAALVKVLRIEPNLHADPDQYSPTYRRRLEELRARVRAMPQRRVTVVANGRAGNLFVDGRPSGSTPMTLFLPGGRYRIGGATGALRVPSFQVDVTDEDRTVVLDFETAEAIRMTAGPGLALPASRRAEGLIRAGAWLDVDKLIVAARGVEGDAQFLVGSIFDVRRGALLREGSVRTVAGGVPSANIGALAAFLLTGAQQKEVRARPAEVLAVSSAPPPDRRPERLLEGEPIAVAALGTPAPPASPLRAPDLRPSPAEPGGLQEGAEDAPAARAKRDSRARAWTRPAAWISGGLALGLAGLAANRRLAANDAYAKASALLGPNGVFSSVADPPRYRALVADGNAAARATWISAGASAVFAVAAGVLGWASVQPAGPAVSF